MNIDRIKEKFERAAIGAPGSKRVICAFDEAFPPENRMDQALFDYLMDLKRNGYDVIITEEDKSIEAGSAFMVIGDIPQGVVPTHHLVRDGENRAYMVAPTAP